MVSCFADFLTTKIFEIFEIFNKQNICTTTMKGKMMLQVQGLTVVTLLFAAVAGDVTALHRHYLQVS